jgi:hypothetical protein
MLDQGTREALEATALDLVDRAVDLINLCLGKQPFSSRTPEGSPALQEERLNRLSALVWLQREVDRLLVVEGKAAAQRGVSYSRIGAATGLTKQRAHQKFRGTEALSIPSRSADA